MDKNLVILGSTGSIGTQTLEIVESNEGLKVLALAAAKNVDLMEKQIRKFAPKVAVMYDEGAAADLKTRVSDTNVKVLTGMEGLLEAVALKEADIVVTALVGMIGVRPTIEAIKAGKTIALANKETLVTAGHIIMPLAKEKGVSILPVDSEHSAIFQSLNGENKARIDKILLTASGGPFRGKSYAELEHMTVEDALKHPNWSMGKKVTIDSASLCNKGLEVMEAKWLFDVDADRIQVLIQPQSIVHSMVQFTDGAVIGQLGVPDMKLPIQYALFYPDRRPMYDNRIDFFKLKEITFFEPDTETFKGLKFAYNAIERGGNIPTVFNAANELAVSLFLSKKINFTQIYDMIEKAMSEVKFIADPDLSKILETEEETRLVLQNFVK
ncbi:MAG: 1-deoxy-D-xylulose-5-phosphate reductoisomerase [Lachnospiraceae bacterium]|nr:1-deoxy-D-xylulose-5-phosphate reductoisomerase [Lachnospiraceae bacterium]